jgi:ribonuclease D
VADLLKLLLKIRSREIDVAARLLARSDDLEALAAGQRKGLALLESWRYEQFGRDALELVEGQAGLRRRQRQAQDGAHRRYRRQQRARPAPAPEESGGE